MTIHFKIREKLRTEILRDIARPHPYAAERVGFISCKPAISEDGLIILAMEYHPVADEDYLRDKWVGAMMGPAAIRKALQLAYNQSISMFHVHVHDHRGLPTFSKTDLRESAKFVPDFFNVQPVLPHGAVIFSGDSGVGRCWCPSTSTATWISKMTSVGNPMGFIQIWHPDFIDKAF